MNNKNVWLADPTINHYFLNAVDSKRNQYLEYRKIFHYIEETEDPEILKQLETFKKEGLALSRATRYYTKAEHLPDSLWTEDSDTELPTPSDYIFKTNNGGLILNETCAKLFQQFRLGETTLTPVHIYDIDTGQQLGDTTYYYLNISERREYIQYPQSDPRFKEFMSREERVKYTTSGVAIEDQVLKVDKAALECDVDLWHDPLLTSRIFFSDALHQALANADMIDKWETVTCQLV